VDALATRGALVRLDLDDPRRFGTDNETTVWAFWDQARRELDLDASFIDEAVARAGGNLQHAAMLRRHVEGAAAGAAPGRGHPERPCGALGAHVGADRRGSVVVDGLGILCAAREALTLDEVGAVSGWGGEAQRRGFLRGALELLLDTRRAEGVAEYRLHHTSIRAHVALAIAGTRRSLRITARWCRSWRHGRHRGTR
jgi:hypothetical protein